MTEADFSVPPPPEAAYPIIYKTKFAIRLLLVVLGLVLLTAGASVVLANFTPDNTPPNAAPAAVGVVVLLLGALCVGLGVYSATLRLTRGTIEIRRGFTKRWLVAEGIKGRRVVLHRGNVVGTALISRRVNEKPLVVGRALKSDAVLNDWLDRFPDLDEVDKAASVAAVTENPLYGATQAARKVALRQASWQAGAAAIASVALSALTLVAPDSLLLVGVLAIIPLAAAALAINARGLLIIARTPNEARPDLSIPLFAPTVALVLRVNFLPAYFPSVGAFWPVVAFSSLVLIVGYIVAEPALLKKPQLIALLIFSLLHCGAVACLVDVRADSSAPLVQGTDITAKYVTTGRGGGPHLTLAAWEGVNGPQAIKVDWDRYHDAYVGQVVCVHTHPGWLGVPWYQLGHCNF